MSTILRSLFLAGLFATSVLAETKVREGSQTMGALPAAQGGVPAGGTAAQVLSKINGTDYNTQWVDPGGGGVTPAALTRTNDTNITLTLGGTPATALLQATSLTLGWSGQLSLARGGTAANLTDPAANTLMGWDDTDNAVKFLTIGSGLTYTHSTHTLSAAGGVGAFTDLSDVPSSYVGKSGEFVTVRSDELGLEFITVNTVSATVLSDAVFSASWDGETVKGATKNTLYDYFHLLSPSDNGKAGVLDQAAGIAVTNSSGVLQTPITDNSSNWNTAFTDRLKWDGGATGLVASTGRTSLGGTTVGQNFFTLTNPSAITFIRVNADNSVDTLSAAAFRTAIGAGTGTGDFVGPSSSTDNAIVRFDGTTGKLGQNSTVTIDDSGHITLEGVTSTGATGTGKFVFDTAPQISTIELGAASDTTIARSSGGHISVEGSVVGLASDTLSFFTTSTSNTIGVGNIELGATSDTTLSRSGAGVLQVEGVVVPTISSTNTLTNKRVNPRVTAISSNATWSPSADTDDVYEITAQAAAVTTISNPSGTPVDGQKLIIRAKDNGTARALTWSGSQWRASSDLALPTTTTLSKTLYLGFIYNSADTKWDLVAKLDNF